MRKPLIWLYASEITVVPFSAASFDNLSNRSLEPGAPISMTSKPPPTPAVHARRVIAQTIAAWDIAPAAPREVARRAPRGYVPIRTVRRLRAVALASGRTPLAHSW